MMAKEIIAVDINYTIILLDLDKLWILKQVKLYKENIQKILSKIVL